MSPKLVISASAMISPVGLNGLQTYHSVRCGISRFRELAWDTRHGDAIVMASLPEGCIPQNAESYMSQEESLTERFAHLMTALYPQLAEWVPHNCPFILGLPAVEECKLIDIQQLIALMGQAIKVPLDLGTCQVIAKGRASGLLALHQAVQLLRSEQHEAVVIGGVDSYKDKHVLARLDEQGRLKSGRTLDGFIPGEGSGLLLLTTDQVAEKRGWPILAEILASAEGYEEGHWYSDQPYRGDGLAQTFTSLMAQAGATKIGRVYSSMNGEHYWGKEWGVALIRNRANFEEQLCFEHPADCYGDLGAAIGPVMIELAMRGRGKQGLPTLVYTSSDTGARAACLIA